MRSGPTELAHDVQHEPGLGRLRALVHPFVALPLWSAAFVIWHLDGPYQASLDHPLLHAGEHFSLFLAGALMWLGLGWLAKGEAKRARSFIVLGWLGVGQVILHTKVKPQLLYSNPAACGP